MSLVDKCTVIQASPLSRHFHHYALMTKQNNLSLMTRFLQLLCLITLLLPSMSACGKKTRRTTAPFIVMSYNVENLFDTDDDPHTDDNEFLPDGKRHWTQERYNNHLRQTARVILAAGENGETPALVGLCEVENDAVLNRLIRHTPLRREGYRSTITRGNDPRGINNALLYRPDRFRLLGTRSVRIPFAQRTKRSRDLLHVWGRIDTGDTLDVIVCHFPSRRSGRKASEPARLDAARCVRRLCDSLGRLRRRPHLIVMGDFNDTPTDRSIRLLTGNATPGSRLINLFADPRQTGFSGSHYYRGQWAQLDQMLVSPLLSDRLMRAHVFAPDFLLTDDGRRRSSRPLRIYNGFRYEGGFSDHLPIVAVFRRNG